MWSHPGYVLMKAATGSLVTTQVDGSAGLLSFQSFGFVLRNVSGRRLKCRQPNLSNVADSIC